MIVSRTIFGINGNRLVSFLSWMLAVGWETILTTLAVLASYTILYQMGLRGGTITEAVALVIIASAVVLAGIYGYKMVMRLEFLISVVTGVLTIVFIILVFNHVNFHTLVSMKSGSAPEVIGAFCFIMVGFGLGWTAIAGDYARYVPRKASGPAVAFWTTAGAALPCSVMLVFGLLLAGSSTHLSNAVGANPIGALATILPLWFMIPFLLVAVSGMIATATLEIYSSGLALLAVGLPVKRYQAAAIDGAVMIVGSIYIIFIAQNFIGPFEAFLTTIGVPIAVWCGIFLADILMRRKEYVEADFYSAKGRYGSVSWKAVVLLIAGAVVGWGLITNSSVGFLSWQGYFLGPFGLGGVNGVWAYSDLGVVVGLFIVKKLFRSSRLCTSLLARHTCLRRGPHEDGSPLWPWRHPGRGYGESGSHAGLGGAPGGGVRCLSKRRSRVQGDEAHGGPLDPWPRSRRRRGRHGRPWRWRGVGGRPRGR
jgi:purine-cytosine permease-like protein